MVPDDNMENKSSIDDHNLSPENDDDDWEIVNKSPSSPLAAKSMTSIKTTHNQVNDDDESDVSLQRLNKRSHKGSKKGSHKGMGKVSEKRDASNVDEVVVNHTQIQESKKNDLKSNGNDDLKEAKQDEESKQADAVQNDNRDLCPVCLDESPTLAIKTVCGHVFCGSCLQSIYFRNQHTIIICPCCRRRVDMLMENFNSQEIAALKANAQGQNGAERLVISFIQNYNAEFMNMELPTWERIQRIPVFVHQILRDIDIHGVVWLVSHMQLLVVILMGLLYLLSPFDLIPESVLGVFGYADDIFVLVYVLLAAIEIYKSAYAEFYRM
jgi:RING finger protein 170